VLCDLGDFQSAERLLAMLAGSGPCQRAPDGRPDPQRRQAGKPDLRICRAAAVELLTGPLRPNCPLPAMPGTSRVRLIVGFEGRRAEVEEMARVLCEQWQAIGGHGLTTITGARTDALWRWLAGGPAMVEVRVLPGAVVGVVAALAGEVPAAPIQAHAGNGVIKVLPGFEGDFGALVRQRLRPLAQAAGGCLTVVAAPENCPLTAADIWGPPGRSAAIARSLRERFDPAGILNPGGLGA
jgi:FAD/FMN-containing dehydrogenase